MNYPVAIAVLVTLTVLLSWAGLAWLGPLIFTPAVALWWARGNLDRALGFVAAGGGAGMLVGLTAGAGLAAAMLLGALYAVFALIGLMLGTGFREQAPYGQLLARVIAAVYAIACFNVVAGGDAIRANARAWLEHSVNQLQEAPAQGALEGPDPYTVESDSPGTAGQGAEATPPPQAVAAQQEEVHALLTERIAWFIEHWNALIYGVMFIMAMLTALALMAITEWTMRRAGLGSRPTGDFRALRLPDGMVWLAIAAAALWMLDRNHPLGAGRIVVWNGAIMLAGAYWLRGMAIVLFTVTALRIPPLLAVLFLVLFFLAGDAQLLLCALGFFDTWAGFRDRLARVLERRQGNGGGPDSP